MTILKSKNKPKDIFEHMYSQLNRAMMDRLETINKINDADYLTEKEKILLSDLIEELNNYPSDPNAEEIDIFNNLAKKYSIELIKMLLEVQILVIGLMDYNHSIYPVSLIENFNNFMDYCEKESQSIRLRIPQDLHDEMEKEALKKGKGHIEDNAEKIRQRELAKKQKAEDKEKSIPLKKMQRPERGKSLPNRPPEVIPNISKQQSTSPVFQKINKQSPISLSTEAFIVYQEFLNQFGEKEFTGVLTKIINILINKISKGSWDHPGRARIITDELKEKGLLILVDNTGFPQTWTYKLIEAQVENSGQSIAKRSLERKKKPLVYSNEEEEKAKALNNIQIQKEESEMPEINVEDFGKNWANQEKVGDAEEEGKMPVVEDESEKQDPGGSADIKETAREIVGAEKDPKESGHIGLTSEAFKVYQNLWAKFHSDEFSKLSREILMILGEDSPPYRKTQIVDELKAAGLLIIINPETVCRRWRYRLILLPVTNTGISIFKQSQKSRRSKGISKHVVEESDSPGSQTQSIPIQSQESKEVSKEVPGTKLTKAEMLSLIEDLTLTVWDLMDRMKVLEKEKEDSDKKDKKNKIEFEFFLEHIAGGHEKHSELLKLGMQKELELQMREGQDVKSQNISPSDKTKIDYGEFMLASDCSQS